MKIKEFKNFIKEIEKLSGVGGVLTIFKDYNFFSNNIENINTKNGISFLKNNKKLFSYYNCYRACTDKIKENINCSKTKNLLNNYKYTDLFVYSVFDLNGFNKKEIKRNFKLDNCFYRFEFNKFLKTNLFKNIINNILNINDEQLKYNFLSKLILTTIKEYDKDLDFIKKYSTTIENNKKLNILENIEKDKKIVISFLFNKFTEKQKILFIQKFNKINHNYSKYTKIFNQINDSKTNNLYKIYIPKNYFTDNFPNEFDIMIKYLKLKRSTISNLSDAYFKDLKNKLLIIEEKQKINKILENNNIIVKKSKLQKI